MLLKSQIVRFVNFLSILCHLPVSIGNRWLKARNFVNMIIIYLSKIIKYFLKLKFVYPVHFRKLSTMLLHSCTKWFCSYCISLLNFIDFSQFYILVDFHIHDNPHELSYTICIVYTFYPWMYKRFNFVTSVKITIN